jgi:predicted nucleic acid-binding protein
MGPSGDRRVIIDTNAVYRYRQDAAALIQPGEVPVVTRTTLAELRNNALRRPRMFVPGYVGNFPVIAETMDVDLRINIRARLYQLKPGDVGRPGDARIGATAVMLGLPVVTFDRYLARVLGEYGIEVRGAPEEP